MARVSASELLELWSDEPMAQPEMAAPVYDQLRRIAHRELQHLRPGQTLGTTALVHEAFMRLADGGDGHFADQRHLLATAALAMRQILIDHCRRRAAMKRGAEAERVALDIADREAKHHDDERRAIDVLALEKALTGLASIETRLAKLVVLRFYGGLTLDEAASCLEVSSRTAKRDWQKARLFLWQVLDPSGAPG